MPQLSVSTHVSRSRLRSPLQMSGQHLRWSPHLGLAPGQVADYHPARYIDTRRTPCAKMKTSIRQDKRHACFSFLAHLHLRSKLEGVVDLAEAHVDPQAHRRVEWLPCRNDFVPLSFVSYLHLGAHIFEADASTRSRDATRRCRVPLTFTRVR
ncbi:hypothetical protein OE88DRAFT_481765 [Heliocybe sulcata]|uniref:Uncharacterized protein n=1 Tax=Heliocybe sulcata TaxID=5364 RepID=A0A5C3MUV6_9AGAM|nr:hypothetical protein OE88DRAFT_481765 [Heliocybe sulcata]